MMRNGIENLCGLFKEDRTKKKWKIVQKTEELENRGKITPKRQKKIYVKIKTIWNNVKERLNLIKLSKNWFPA